MKRQATAEERGESALDWAIMLGAALLVGMMLLGCGSTRRLNTVEAPCGCTTGRPR